MFHLAPDASAVPTRRRLRWVLLTLLAGGAAGCGAAGAFYGIFIDPLIPPPTIKAEHKMEGKTVLVWVDDSLLARSNPLLRREVVAHLEKDLVARHAVGCIVDYRGVARFRQEHPEAAEWSAQKWGQELHADEVLHVLIERFDLQDTAGAGYYRPGLAGRAQVIDVATGRCLWPADQTHRAFALELPLAQGRGSAFEYQQIRALADALAVELAPCFYKHQTPRAP